MSLLLIGCQKSEMLIPQNQEEKDSNSIESYRIMTASYRGVYVDNYMYFCGDTIKENQFLDWCKRYNFNAISVYDLDNMTQDEILSYPSMDIFDFSISEDNSTIIENGSFHEVSARDVVEQNYKISFTEYDSDSATYGILSTNPTSSKYAIFRITTVEDEVIIDKYYDCVLQNYNKSEGTDVNRYTYDFSCKY